MKLQIDLTKEYGIVLEGGGAKGAYQIGVWKALREHGIRIRGIAGASVGALNGALMCEDDFETAERLWSTISYGRVLAGSERLLERIWERDVKNEKDGAAEAERPDEAAQGMRRREHGELHALLEDTLKLIRDGGFDVSPLRELIKESIDPARIRHSERELYIVTFSVEEKQELTLDVRALPEETIPDMLLASAYFPAFRSRKLGGKRYMDGGMLNNVPTDVLIREGYRDIIVIRIYGMGLDKQPLIKVPKGVSVHKIAPAEDLGGMLQFERERAQENMRLGYFDGLRFLYGLAGEKYYFDCDETEKMCYNIKIMEKMAQKLGIERFRIYQPAEFLALIRETDQARRATGEKSVAEQLGGGESFFSRLTESLGRKE